MNISKEQLKEIIESHEKWLKGEEGGKRSNLSGADLISADLSGADLISADLSGSNLRSADLSGANLRSADLSGANLRSADLSGSNLSGANLISADLSGSNLRSAYLSGAYLDKKYVQISCIGSRLGTTTYCVDDNNVTCGCWNSYKGGTLEEFKQRIDDVYGENGSSPNEKYYREYFGAIEYFKTFLGERA